MSTLDDFGNEIRKTASDAFGKVKEVTEVVKLKDTISSEERKISGYYQEIGKNFYDNNPDNSDEVYKTLFDNVKASEQQIEECQDRIFEIKKVTQCKQCGEKMPQTAKYCSNCAAEMVKPVAQPEGEATEEAGNQAFDNMKEAVNQTYSEVKDAVKDTYHDVKETVGQAFDDVKDIVNKPASEKEEEVVEEVTPVAEEVTPVAEEATPAEEEVTPAAEDSEQPAE